MNAMLHSVIAAVNSRLISLNFSCKINNLFVSHKSVDNEGRSIQLDNTAIFVLMPDVESSVKYSSLSFGAFTFANITPAGI